MREFIWTIFWAGLGVLGICFHWPIWVVVILFLLAGFIYIDGDIF